MATKEEILEAFPGVLGEALAAEEADELETGSESDTEEAVVETASTVEEVEPKEDSEPAEEVEPEASSKPVKEKDPVAPVESGERELASILDKLADKVDAISKPGDVGKTEEEKVEEVKSFLEELGIDLPDFDSAEVQKILDDDMLSPEQKKLFKDQQEKQKAIFEAIGSKFKGLSGDVEDMKIAAANRSFWENVSSSNPDFAEFLKPEGTLMEGVSLTAKTTEWLETQPSFVRDSVKNALEEGNAARVNEALAYIKKASLRKEAGGTEQKVEAVDKDATLEEKIKSAEKLASTPKSLNDIPGKTVPTSAEKQLEDSDDISATAEMLSGGDPKKLKELMTNVLTAA